MWQYGTIHANDNSKTAIAIKKLEAINIPAILYVTNPPTAITTITNNLIDVFDQLSNSLATDTRTENIRTTSNIEIMLRTINDKLSIIYKAKYKTTIVCIDGKMNKITTRNDGLITQKLLDALIKLCMLPQVNYYTNAHNLNIIFCSILLSVPNLSYENAYNIYNKYAAHSYYDTRSNKLMVNSYSKYGNEHIYIKLFKNKTLPLSESDTLHVLKYNAIANLLCNNKDNCFTPTYDTLYAMISGDHRDICLKYKKQISEVIETTHEYSNTLFTRWRHMPDMIGAYINNRKTTDTREYMDALIKYCDIEYIDTYMRNNSLQYTIENLECACAAVKDNVVRDIVNNKILPNKKCIDSIVDALDRYKCYPDRDILNIVEIFAKCGYPIPRHTMRQVLQSAGIVRCVDMRSILTYGCKFECVRKSELYVHHVSECDDDDCERE